jgi:hypothetical protein
MHVFSRTTDAGWHGPGDNDSSLQVEAASGKRLKIKAAAVLLRYAEPSPSTLVAEAQTQARELDPNFLWEVSGDDEFGFADLAREYFGHAPLPVEAAAVAMTLASAPMFFYKRGKGRYRKAPPDALKAALASVERKKREAEQMAGWTDELRAHRLPDALRAKLPMLLYQPDKKRSNGRRSPQPAIRRRRVRWRSLPCAAQFRRRTTSISTRSWRRRSRRGPISRRTVRCRRLRICQWPMPRRSR